MSEVFSSNIEQRLFNPAQSGGSCLQSESATLLLRY